MEAEEDDLSKDEIVCTNILSLDNGRFDISFCNDADWSLESIVLNDSLIMGSFFVQGWVAQDLESQLLLNCSFKEYYKLNFETVRPILIHRNELLLSTEVTTVNNQKVFIQKSKFRHQDQDFHHLVSWAEIDTLALMKLDFYSGVQNEARLKEMEKLVLSYQVTNIHLDSMIYYAFW